MHSSILRKEIYVHGLFRQSYVRNQDCQEHHYSNGAFSQLRSFTHNFEHLHYWEQYQWSGWISTGKPEQSMIDWNW